MASLSLRQTIEAFSPQSVLNFKGFKTLTSCGSLGRQIHWPGSIPMPSEYQLASQVYLNCPPGLMISVSMEIGLPAQATDRSSVQLSLMGDLSKFLNVQTVGLLQQRPAANTCHDKADNATQKAGRRSFAMIKIPKPLGLRPT